MTIPAKYENGVFRPLEIVQMKEGTVVEVLVPAEQEPARKRRSIKDLPFYGMWKDRADIGDGVDYVNKLRENPRG
jgi:predicted DNA-binding antitoxin AbrB/MazE fold protein